MVEKSNLFFELQQNVEFALKKYNELFDIINIENYSTSIKMELKQNISHIESILNTSSQNPYQVSNFLSNVAVAINNTVNNFKKISKSKNADFLLNELSEISKSINSIVENSNYSDEEIANQFNAFLDSKSNRNNKNEKKIKEDDSSSYKRLEQIIEEQKIKVDSLISSSLENLSETKSKLDEFKNYLDKETPLIREKLETSNNFFANVGGAKLAEHYQLQASIEKNLADIFRHSFIASFITVFLMIIFLSVYFYQTTQETLSLNFVFIKIITISPILLLFSAGATYLIKESNKHRSRQNILNDKFLALSTIDLYISSLDKEDHIKIKTKLSDYFFTNNIENIKNPDGFAIDAQETINRLIDAASRKK